MSGKTDRKARPQTRNVPTVWAPRLGGAAIVGYGMTVVLLLSRSG